MANHVLSIKENGVLITAGIELRNGKSNPFGWSTHEIWYVKDVGAYVPDEKRIGDLYCGVPENFIDGYTFEITDAPEPRP